MTREAARIRERALIRLYDGAFNNCVASREVIGQRRIDLGPLLNARRQIRGALLPNACIGATRCRLRLLLPLRPVPCHASDQDIHSLGGVAFKDLPQSIEPLDHFEIPAEGFAVTGRLALALHLNPQHIVRGNRSSQERFPGMVEELLHGEVVDDRFGLLLRDLHVPIEGVGPVVARRLRDAQYEMIVGLVLRAVVAQRKREGFQVSFQFSRPLRSDLGGLSG